MWESRRNDGNDDNPELMGLMMISVWSLPSWETFGKSQKNRKIYGTCEEIRKMMVKYDGNDGHVGEMMGFTSDLYTFR